MNSNRVSLRRAGTLVMPTWSMECTRKRLALSEKNLEADPTNQFMLQAAGYAYAKSGRRREAEEVIKRFKDIAKTQYVMSYWIASIYAALGDKDKALAELEDAYAGRDWYLHRLKVDPFWDPLRDDPRFKDMLKRLNLPG